MGSSSASSARMIGTAEITQPCRSAVMKSRSGQTLEVKHSLQRAVAFLADKGKAGWRPCRVYRGQDRMRLSANSGSQLHGFVVLEVVRYPSDTVIVVLSILAALVASLLVAALSSPLAASFTFLPACVFACALVRASEHRIVRMTGVARLYIRLDWGEDGLALQQHRDINDVLRCMGGSDKEPKELLDTQVVADTFRGVATSKNMPSGMMFAKVAASAAEKICTPLVAAAFLSIALVGVVGVVGAIEMRQKRAPTDTWVPTKHGASLGDVALELMSTEKPYDLEKWNCNHVADAVCNVVLA